MLRYHKNWFLANTKTLSEESFCLFSLRLYTLLIVFNFPLTAEEIFLLRSIFRNMHDGCSDTIWTEPSIKWKNIITCLIVNYYGQSDLNIA